MLQCMKKPALYRKKPVVVEAMRFDGSNHADVVKFCNCVEVSSTEHLYIRTLEGTMRADVGDWIIKGVEGEFYPCKPSVFESTYEPIAQSTHDGQ